MGFTVYIQNRKKFPLRRPDAVECIVLHDKDKEGNPLTWSLNEIKENLKACSQLQKLTIENCSSTILKDELDSLGSLKELEIKGGKIENIDQCCTLLSQLEYLNISNCNFLDLSIIYEKCKNLKHLEIVNCKVESIPNEIENLNQLERLVVVKNKIKDVSHNISKLHYLKWILLGQNNVLEIPPLPPSLLTFAASNNKIYQIPSFVEELPDLVFLDISHNPVKEINLAKAPKLQRLFMGHVTLQKDPILPKSLTFLLAESMQLKNLDFIRNLEELKFININNNKLLTPEIIDTIAFLPDLKSINTEGLDFIGMQNMSLFNDFLDFLKKERITYSLQNSLLKKQLLDPPIRLMQQLTKEELFVMFNFSIDAFRRNFGFRSLINEPRDTINPFEKEAVVYIGKGCSLEKNILKQRLEKLKVKVTEVLDEKVSHIIFGFLEGPQWFKNIDYNNITFYVEEVIREFVFSEDTPFLYFKEEGFEVDNLMQLLTSDNQSFLIALELMMTNGAPMPAIRQFTQLLEETKQAGMEKHHELVRKLIQLYAPLF